MKKQFENTKLISDLTINLNFLTNYSVSVCRNGFKLKKTLTKKVYLFTYGTTNSQKWAKYSFTTDKHYAYIDFICRTIFNGCKLQYGLWMLIIKLYFSDKQCFAITNDCFQCLHFWIIEFGLQRLLKFTVGKHSISTKKQCLA